MRTDSRLQDVLVSIAKGVPHDSALSVVYSSHSNSKMCFTGASPWYKNDKTLLNTHVPRLLDVLTTVEKGVPHAALNRRLVHAVRHAVGVLEGILVRVRTRAWHLELRISKPMVKTRALQNFRHKGVCVCGTGEGRGTVTKTKCLKAHHLVFAQVDFRVGPGKDTLNFGSTNL